MGLPTSHHPRSRWGFCLSLLHPCMSGPGQTLAQCELSGRMGEDHMFFLQRGTPKHAVSLPAEASHVLLTLPLREEVTGERRGRGMESTGRGKGELTAGHGSFCGKICQESGSCGQYC